MEIGFDGVDEQFHEFEAFLFGGARDGAGGEAVDDRLNGFHDRFDSADIFW